MATSTGMIEWAAEQAATLLMPLGNRWLHTLGVVARAREVEKAFNESDQEALIAAAYIHDIGYAPSLTVTGFHPIDGAYYLLEHDQSRLASLVAYHSGAQFEARLRGLSETLKMIPRECSIVADALTFCDMTTGQTGLRISFEERLADIFQRYDKAHIVNQAIHQEQPSLKQAISRAQRLSTDRTLV